MKVLSKKHEMFLTRLGLDIKDWMYVRTDYESYTFYNIPKEKEWNFRR